MSDNKRPRFDDPLPGEGGPHRASPPAPEPAAAPPDASQRPGDASLPSQATQVLLDPTVTRLTLLLSNLVLLTENGDLALWASLMALDRVLRGLEWGADTPRLSKQRFYSLLQVTLVRYAELLHEHVERLALLQDSEPDPALPSWPPTLSVEMYDLVDAMFPAETSSGDDLP